MNKVLIFLFTLTAVLSFSNLRAQQAEDEFLTESVSPLKTFVGRVVGEDVRIKITPNLDSHVVLQMPGEDYVILTAEKGGFSTLKPPSHKKGVSTSFDFALDPSALEPESNIPLFEKSDNQVTILMPPDTRFFISCQIGENDEPPFSFDLPHGGSKDKEFFPHFGPMLSHEPNQADFPDLPSETLHGILANMRSLGMNTERDSLKAEPDCSCPHCQIARASSIEIERISD